MSSDASWQIGRRTFLRGVGAAIALPALEAMGPLSSVARGAEGALGGAAVATAAGPRRMAFVYIPNGVTMAEWAPGGNGADLAFGRILQPLEKFKKDITVLTGFEQKMGFALGDAEGDHARASASFLTGVHPRKTSGADIRNGISVDQIAATHVGAQTALPSLELSCDAGSRMGSCDSGYSCAYSYNISWRSPTMPMLPEVEPRAVFERLFGDVKTAADTQTARSRRAALQKSILDFVQTDASRVRSRLGHDDRDKLDEYLTSVREIERRVDMMERSALQLPADARAPEGYEGFEAHARLMFDMLVLAFQTDSTRIATFILGHEGSNRPYPEIGVSDGHHSVSHHMNNPVLIEKITKINTLHASLLAYFLDKLKRTREGDSNLLDQSMIVYGSGIGDGNRHNHDDLPVLLAGHGGNTITGGRHIRATTKTPLNNVYLAMLDRMGAPIDHLGDSTARFDLL